MKHAAVILGVIVIVLAIVYAVAQRTHAPTVDLNSNGISPQEQVAEMREDIKITQPEQSASIVSPLEVRGEAVGTWFFEATLPIVVVDWDGRIIGEGYAEALGEWMTEELVPFSGTITFDTPEYGERGAVIFRKNNPSGLPEHDDALEVPVTFRK